MKQTRFPEGWNARRAKRVLEHYEKQTEEAAVVEDEEAYGLKGQTVMSVPSELVPAVCDLIEVHSRERGKRQRKRSRRPSRSPERET